MSLALRLWLAIAITMLISFIGSYWISLLTARHYLQQQLYAQSEDAAGSLALAMNQLDKDPATIETMVNASFDNGHFHRIRYQSTDQQLDIDRVQARTVSSVPAWFRAQLPIEINTAYSQVSNGWAQAGTIQVQADPDYAYQSLWRGAKILLLAFAVIGAAAAWIGSLFLRRVLTPLQSVVAQAEAICDRRFVTVPGSNIPELARVTAALNTMVARLQRWFDEHQAQIHQLQQQANLDTLTGVANARYFAARAVAMLQSEDAASAHQLLLMQLPHLQTLNERCGSDVVDEGLRAFALALQQRAQGEHDTIIGRLSASEFGVLCTSAHQPLWHAAIPTLMQLVEQRFKDQLDLASVHCAAAADWQDSLHQARIALERAQLQHAPQLQTTPAAHAGWTVNLQQRLQSDALHLAGYAVQNAQGQSIHEEQMLRLQVEGGGEDGEGRELKIIGAADLLPAAHEAGLLALLDRRVVELGLQKLQHYDGRIALNLSASFLHDAGLREQLLHTLQQAGDRCRRLALEFSDLQLPLDEASRHSHIAFFAQLRALGLHLGLEQVGRHIDRLPAVQLLGFDYLKLDPAFVAGVAERQDIQSLVRAVVVMSRGLELQLIAVGVRRKEEWELLQTLGVSGVSGPVLMKA